VVLKIDNRKKYKKFCGTVPTAPQNTMGAVLNSDQKSVKKAANFFLIFEWLVPQV